MATHLRAALGAAAIVALLLGPAARGADQQSALPALTLGDCIRRALAHGLDLQGEKHTVDIARDAISDARSEFDPVLQASTATGVTRIGADGTTPRSRLQGTSANLGLLQRFGVGADLSLSTNLDRSDLDPAVASLNPAYASDATLALRQPLLKGFGTAVNRAFIRRSEIGFENAEWTYQSRALDVIQATENAYYLLAGAREQRQVFEASLVLAEKLLEEAKARNAAGMATRLDVLQAEVGVANARRGVLEASNAVEDGEDALRSLMGRIDPDERLGATRMEMIDGLTLPEMEASYATALARQPEYHAARNQIDLAQLDTKLAGDDLKPSLDLDVALGFNGSDRSGEGAYSDVLAGEDTTWQAGLIVTYPIGRRGPKARYRQAQSRLLQQQVLLEQFEQDILLDVRAAVRDVQTAHDSVQIAAQSAQLAVQQYEAELARFKAGLSTSRRVLEAQTDLQSARVAHLQAQLDLSTALAGVRRIEGSSADRFGIELSARVPQR